MTSRSDEEQEGPRQDLAVTEVLDPPFHPCFPFAWKMVWDASSLGADDVSHHPGAA